MAKKIITAEDYEKDLLSQGYQIIDPTTGLTSKKGAIAEAATEKAWDNLTAPIVRDISGQLDKVTRFDENLTESDLNDLEEFRATQQSNFDKFIRLFPRATGKAVSEIVKIPGTLYGVGEWAATGFDQAQFEETVNNAWVQGIDEFTQETMDEQLPVYKRNVVEQGGFMRQVMSPEFWATEGADGIGFLVSMLAPGAALKGLKVGTGLSRLAYKVPSVGGRASLRFGANAESFLSAGVNTLFEAAAEGVEAAKSTESAIKNKKLKEYIDQGYDQTTAAELTAQYLETDEAKLTIGKAGAGTMATNMALLIGSNMWDEINLFNGFNRANKVAKANLKGKLADVISEVDDAGKILNSITRTSGVDYAKLIGKKLAAGAVKEGLFEEGMQYATSKYFENKALGLTDDNVVEGVLSSYADSLGDTDFQKSVFLGSVLGSTMGAIGAAREQRVEDKVLFGDGQKDQGLVGLLKKNFVQRYKSINDIAARDEDGNIIYKDKKQEDSLAAPGSERADVPQIDITKAGRWATDILKGETNKSMLQALSLTNMVDEYDYAKMVNDFNYMLPYLQQEGGLDLLNAHIELLSQQDADYLAELGIEVGDTQTIKEDLQNKARIFDDVLGSAQLLHRPARVEGSRDQVQAFNDEIFDTKLSTELNQRFFIDKIRAYQDRIDTLEAKETRTQADEIELTSSKAKVESFTEALNKSKEYSKTLYDEKSIDNLWQEYQRKANDIESRINKEAAKTESSKSMEKAVDEAQPKVVPTAKEDVTGKKVWTQGDLAVFKDEANNKVQLTNKDGSKVIESFEGVNTKEAIARAKELNKDKAKKEKEAKVTKEPIEPTIPSEPTVEPEGVTPVDLQRMTTPPREDVDQEVDEMFNVANVHNRLARSIKTKLDNGETISDFEKDEYAQALADAMAAGLNPINVFEGTSVEKSVDSYEDGETSEVTPELTVEDVEDKTFVEKKRKEPLTISRRDRDFVMTEAGRKVSIEKYNKEYLKVSNPDNYGVGTKVKLIIDTNFDGEVYAYDSAGRIIVEAGEYKTEKKTFKDLEANSNEIPIRIESDGVLLGYLPTVGWTNQIDPAVSPDNADKYNNIYGETVEEVEAKIEQLKNLRKNILDSYKTGVVEFDSVISERGAGVLNITSEKDENNNIKKESIKKAMPEFIGNNYSTRNNIPPFVAFDGSNFIYNDTILDEDSLIMSSEFKESLQKDRAYKGSIFMIVPSAINGKFIASPVSVSNLGTKETTSITEAIRAFVYSDSKVADGLMDNGFRKDILANVKNLKEYLEQFVYFDNYLKLKDKKHSGKHLLVLSIADKPKIEFKAPNKQTRFIPLDDFRRAVEENDVEAINRYETLLSELKDVFLPNKRFSVKASQITKGVAVPYIQENKSVRVIHSDYKDMMSSILQTTIREQIDSDGKPVYTHQATVVVEEPTIDTKVVEAKLEEPVVKEVAPEEIPEVKPKVRKAPPRIKKSTIDRINKDRVVGDELITAEPIEETIDVLDETDVNNFKEGSIKQIFQSNLSQDAKKDLIQQVKDAKTESDIIDLIDKFCK